MSVTHCYHPDKPIRPPGCCLYGGGEGDKCTEEVRNATILLLSRNTFVMSVDFPK